MYDQKRLEIPTDIQDDGEAIELATIWFSRNKVKIMTRSGTGLDENVDIWGEILASLAENVALCVEDMVGRPVSETLSIIKKSVDHNWREGG